MKNLLADRPTSQNDTLESEGKSCQDLIELNRDRATRTGIADRISKSLISDEPYHQQTKENQQTQNTARNRNQSFPQPAPKATCKLAWDKIGQRILDGVQWTVFSVGAIATVVMVVYEPSPSTKQQPLATANNSAQTLEVPTSPVPQESLPLPNPALPQLSPQEQGLGKQPLTLNSPLDPTVAIPDPLNLSPSQKSLDQPLSVSPSLDKAPSPKPELNSEPSLSGTDPVIPPTLPSNLPPADCSCANPCMDKAASLAASAQNANTNHNSLITEVRNYFKTGWQPPSGLKQTLEYSISVNADGTIQRIRPLSNAAGEYIDRTNLPMPGSVFISPQEGGGNTSIYLAMTPDGKVKASLE